MLLGARQFFERRGTPTPPLPYDAEVEYLESTGTQWIDTGINPSIAPKVVAGINLSNSADRDYWGNNLTSGLVASSVFIANFANYALAYYRYASSTSANATSAVSVGVFHSLIVGKEVYVDGVLSYTSPNTFTGDVNQTNIFLYKSGRGNAASFKCSYFKMFDGSILVRDFIPVRFTNEQGVSEGAMYDRLGVGGMNPDGSPRTDGLYRNRGTGAFLWAEKQ